MRLFLKTHVFFSFLMCLALGSALTSAQEDADGEAPIIALSNNNIYAVSPIDGEARVLGERDAEQDARLNEMFVSPTLALSPISPDQTSFAYIAPLYEVLDPAFAADAPQIVSMRPTDITVVDIASGTQTPITNQGATFAESIAQHNLSVHSNLTWSQDGRRLYFLTTTLSLRNRLPEYLIEYYDLDSGQREVFVHLTSQTRFMGLYAVSEGLVMLTRKDDNIAFEFTLYDPDGTVLNVVEQDLPDWLGVTNGTMLLMNPVFQGYGYYSEDSTGLVPSLLDIATGESRVLGLYVYPAFVSHANPDESLRVVLLDASGSEDTLWVVVDSDGIGIPSLSLSLKGVVFQSEIALSPDGDRIAFLKPGGIPYEAPVPIMVMDEEGVRELDFAANQIQWGVIDYAFSSAVSSN
jgi:hypothetical protein